MDVPLGFPQKPQEGFQIQQKASRPQIVRCTVLFVHPVLRLPHAMPGALRLALWGWLDSPKMGAWSLRLTHWSLPKRVLTPCLIRVMETPGGSCWFSFTTEKDFSTKTSNFPLKKGTTPDDSGSPRVKVISKRQPRIHGGGVFSKSEGLPQNGIHRCLSSRRLIRAQH